MHTRLHTLLPCSPLPHSVVWRHCTVWCGGVVVWQGTVWCGSVQCSVACYSVVLQVTVRCSVVVPPLRQSSPRPAMSRLLPWTPYPFNQHTTAMHTRLHTLLHGSTHPSLPLSSMAAVYGGVARCSVVWHVAVWCGRAQWCGRSRCGVVWCGVAWCSAVGPPLHQSSPHPAMSRLLPWTPYPFPDLCE